MQWREYLVSEIQDSLRDTYKIYQTDQKVYQESELKKLLTRLDFMISTYCRNQIFKVFVLFREISPTGPLLSKNSSPLSRTNNGTRTTTPC